MALSAAAAGLRRLRLGCEPAGAGRVLVRMTARVRGGGGRVQCVRQGQRGLGPAAVELLR